MPDHALNRETLIAAGAPIFLVDSFFTLLLYYAVGYPPHIPFPPPQGSLLRKTMNAQKQNRKPMPALLMIRAGIDDVQPFLDMLIEEAETGEQGAQFPSFEEFMGQLREQVWQQLKASQDSK